MRGEREREQHRTTSPRASWSIFQVTINTRPPQYDFPQSFRQRKCKKDMYQSVYVFQYLITAYLTEEVESIEKKYLWNNCYKSHFTLHIDLQTISITYNVIAQNRMTTSLISLSTSPCIWASCSPCWCAPVQSKPVTGAAVAELCG